MQLPSPFMLSMDGDGVITVAYDRDEDARLVYDALEGQQPASLPTDTAKLVERLKEESLLRVAEKHNLNLVYEDDERVLKDICTQAASLIQSQAARIAELERAASAALEAALRGDAS